MNIREKLKIRTVVIAKGMESAAQFLPHPHCIQFYIRRGVATSIMVESLAVPVFVFYLHNDTRRHKKTVT